MNKSVGVCVHGLNHLICELILLLESWECRNYFKYKAIIISISTWQLRPFQSWFAQRKGRWKVGILTSVGLSQRQKGWFKWN